MLNRRYKIMFFIYMLCGGMLLSGFGDLETGISAEHVLSAGIAKIKITPETPIVMSGYGGRDDPFKGVHDDLYSRVIVFSDGSQKAVIITADLIGLSREFCEEVGGIISRDLGIQRDFILISATHTHGGPSTGRYEARSDAIEQFVQTLKTKIIEAAKEADSKLRPVTVGAGKGECLMNINRRARTAEGIVELGRNPYGPCDHEVAVAKINNLDGNEEAVFINWPCHGTVMGPNNYQITGDWPGAAARYVENKYGNGVTAPVTAGASGDINPIYGPHMDFQEVNAYAYGMEAIGMYVGEEVLKVARNVTTSPRGSISAARRVITLPGKERGRANTAPEKLVPARDVDVVLSALKVGNIIFSGISAEVFNEIGMQIKKQSPFANTIVITHCNGGSGYLVTDKAYEEGGYEVRVTRAMPGAEQALVKNMLEMISELD